MTPSSADHPRGPTGAARPLLLDPDLRIVFGITIMSIIGTFTVSPALPHVMRELAISQAQIGLVMALFTVPGIFIMPIIGLCADLFGRRKVVGLCLLLFGAAGGACYGAGNFQGLLTLRFLQGIGAAPLSSLNIAFISDLFSGQRRVAAMGYNQAVLSVAAAALTALGGALASVDWRYPFILPVLGIPIGLQVMLCWQPRQSAPQPARWRDYSRQLCRTLRQSGLGWHYLIAVLGLMVVWGCYFVYFPVLMSVKLHQSTSTIGVVMTTMLACSALSSALINRLSRLFSGKDLYRISFGLYALSLALIPAIEHTWLLPVPVAGIGIAQGIFIPNLQRYLGNLSSAHNRGVVMALYGSAIRTGQALGPLFMSLMFPLLRIEGVFWLGASMALALVILVSCALKS